ncbi:MAG: type III-B CRISPR module RAMP protein Cmr1 [Bacillota bacterium]|jgi:CRISPR-associated protein Cmr1
MSVKTYTCKALTDIWTGDADGKPDRLITTGLLGSIRWWFEVLVRGLDGSACDPTRDGIRCPDHRVDDPTKRGHHCVVCELFGCTGWARKFRFEVLDGNGNVKVSQIKQGDTFKLRFLEIRRVEPEEWVLLDLTLRLIADYGAIGGKTVYKPSDESSRQHLPHHRDYGLIKIDGSPPLPSLEGDVEKTLRGYVDKNHWRKPDHDEFAWASLENFWCVKSYHLARQDSNTSTFNRVIGRPEPKNQSQGGDSWLAGRRARGGASPQPAESKKVFSFKEPESARRTFGFVESPDRLDQLGGELQKSLAAHWPGFDPSDSRLFKRGLEILTAVIAASWGVRS